MSCEKYFGKSKTMGGGSGALELSVLNKVVKGGLH